jgi:hypothetical protein
MEMEDLQINRNDENQAAAVEVESMNVFQRIIGIIVSPGKTMQNLIVRPRILFPILMIAISSLLLILINMTQYKEYMRASTEVVMENMGMTLTPEQLDMQMNFSAITSLITTPIIYLVIWLIGTAILFGIVKAFKGEGKFKQFMSITGFAWVITVLSYIVMTAVSYATGSFNLELPVTSVASILPADLKGNFVYGLARGIELFSIWQYVVIAIGVTQLSKLSKTKVYSIIGSIYAVYLLYAGSSEILTSMFMK